MMVEFERLQKHPPLLQQRTQALFRDAAQGGDASVILARALDELQSAVETLQAFDQELRRQQAAYAALQAQAQAELIDYQQLFEGAPDAYLVTGLDGTIRRANQAAITLFGVPERQLVRRSLGHFVPDGERRQFRAALHTVACMDRLDHWEVLLQQHDGTPMAVDATVTRVCNSHKRPVALRWQLRATTLVAYRTVTLVNHHEHNGGTQSIEAQRRWL